MGHRTGPIDPVCVAGYYSNWVVMACFYNIFNIAKQNILFRSFQAVFLSKRQLDQVNLFHWYVTLMLDYLLVE